MQFLQTIFLITSCWTATIHKKLIGEKMKRKLMIAIGLAISMPSIASSVSISINQKWSSTWREYVQYADVQSTTDEIEIHNLELNRGNCEYYWVFRSNVTSDSGRT